MAAMDSRAWIFATVAPDSFALLDRFTYTSPIGKDIYERIHALRTSEIKLPWRH